MKKLCAKQNWRAKQWEFSQTVRTMRKFRNAKIRNAKISQCEISQRISQCEISQCEISQRISQCEISQCEISQRISQCEKPHCEFRNAKNHSEFRNAKFRNAKNHFAKFAMRKTTFRNAKWLPTDCQNSCFAFFSKYAPKFQKKTTKLMQDKLHKSKN